MFSHLRGSPCRILRNPQTVFSVYAAACVARANRNTPQPRFPLRIAMPPHAAYQSTQTNAIQRKQHRTATPPTPSPLLNHASPRKQRYKPALPTPTVPTDPKTHAPLSTHQPKRPFPLAIGVHTHTRSRAYYNNVCRSVTTLPLLNY